MTKRRRNKICKIMNCAYIYIEKGKFEYLLRQDRLYHKHEAYLNRMNKRAFNRLVKVLLTKYTGKE